MGRAINRQFEAVWHDFATLRLDWVPLEWQPWLFESGSMTSRLQEYSGGKFKVVLLNQEKAKPRVSERVWLGLNKHEPAIVRQVYLRLNKKVIGFARSLFSLKCLQGKGLSVKRLGSTPLGNALYADPNLLRCGLQFAKLRAGHHDFQPVVSHAKNLPAFLWARRSVFDFYGYPAMVSEIFLPDLLDGK